MIVLDPDYTSEQITEILARRAEALARPEAAGLRQPRSPFTEPTPGDLLQLLVFQLGGERFGIEMAQVLEIYPTQPITAVPRTPAFVIGIFSARGRFLSLANLLTLLGYPGGDIAPHSQIIVVSVNDLEIAFLADNIEGIRPFYEQELQPSFTTPFIRGLAPGMTAVLDLNVVFERGRVVVEEEIGD
jgi:purine-binding chemotaxis protein CheW